MKLTSRKLFLGALIGIIGTLVAAFYFQIVAGYAPCTLCELQRFVFILAAIMLLVAILHRPKNLGIRIYAILVGLTAIGGGVVAIRQLWLQSLPPEQTPACGPGLNFLIHNLPLGEALKRVFEGTADCAVVHWRFFGLSFAGWALVVFVIIFLLMGWQVLRPRR